MREERRRRRRNLLVFNDTVEGDENMYEQTHIQRQTRAMHMHVNAKVKSVQRRASRTSREEHPARAETSINAALHHAPPCRPQRSDSKNQSTKTRYMEFAIPYSGISKRKKSKKQRYLEYALYHTAVYTFQAAKSSDAETRLCGLMCVHTT